ncbi:MAG: P1 family peptidase, partial [Gemmatimonadota bacterium]
MAPRTLAALVAVVAALAPALGAGPAAQTPAPRPRARDLGITIGVLPPGPLNAITDVAGVRVGQVTVAIGDSINTGITAILPHGGNVFIEKVPAAVSVGNGFGKLTGIAQIRELGEIESPIVLTCTLCVPRAADAVLTYLLGLPGNENVQSANAVVGETNDGGLNRIRLRPITEAQVLEALRSAREGPVEEGSVGAARERPLHARVAAPGPGQTPGDHLLRQLSKELVLELGVEE